MPIRSPDAEPARLYLRNRGLSLVPPMLRMHPGLHYRDLDGNRSGPFPTLISPVVDAQGRGICLHRVYLTPDGKKAPVGEPKKLMSHPNDVPTQGSAVRLFRYTDTLAVAEGIETAIAVTEATRIPCWAYHLDADARVRSAPRREASHRLRRQGPPVQGISEGRGPRKGSRARQAALGSRLQGFLGDSPFGDP